MTSRSLQVIQKTDSFTLPIAISAMLGKKRGRHSQGSLCVLWACSMRRRGGVCSKHCSTLLRKHVFPLLCRPWPSLEFGGHVVSIAPECRVVAVLPFGVCPSGVAGDLRGVERVLSDFLTIQETW